MLNREEFVEQAHFFRAFAGRMAEGCLGRLRRSGWMGRSRIVQEDLKVWIRLAPADLKNRCVGPTGHIPDTTFATCVPP